ncbi:MAG: hypothetical protein ABW033_11390, partial [Acidimicrobiia bacterium]
RRHGARRQQEGRGRGQRRVGITSKVQLDGRSVTTYHYVMTQDFPYSVSCFRGVAVGAPRSS